MPSVWSESPLSRRPRWWDGGAASRRPPPMRRGPPAILSQDPGCQRPVLAVGSSSSRGSARVLTPAPAHTRSYLCLDRKPRSLSSAGLGLHAHPCNQLHVGPRTFSATSRPQVGGAGWPSGQRAATGRTAV